VVFVGSGDKNVYALNASTGAKLWRRKMGYGVFSSPAVANGVVYFSAYKGNTTSKVYALNARTGVGLWSYATFYGSYSSPAVANGVVYIGAGNDVDAFGLK
jgi:eukaryotic-like serine/threonine-protein kinase